MVGKIVSSSAPYSCANYCLNHDEATILCWEGLDIDPTEAAELARSTGEARLQLASAMAYAIDTSFSIQAETNTEVQKPVGHISLCFMKEDAPLLNSRRMAQIAREYMEMMGYQNTQYMVVRHCNAKGNPHVHIFFNRVDNCGRCLNAWQDFRRNGIACRALTEKYGLNFAQGRRNTIVQDLHGREKARYQISNAIDAALPRPGPAQSRTGAHVTGHHDGDTPPQQRQHPGPEFQQGGRRAPERGAPFPRLGSRKGIFLREDQEGHRRPGGEVRGEESHRVRHRKKRKPEQESGTEPCRKHR